jgi:hypothetical protein
VQAYDDDERHVILNEVKNLIAGDATAARWFAEFTLSVVEGLTMTMIIDALTLRCAVGAASRRCECSR